MATETSGDEGGAGGSVAFARHDHVGCIVGAMRSAEWRCAAEGLHFTKVRRRVLEILLDAHVAIGAYDILDRLRREGLGSLPPTVYRALDFLVTNGFAHRIERRNAFVACARPGTAHEPAFLICRGCDTVAETAVPDMALAFGPAARATGFAIAGAVLEAEGLCPACQPRRAG